jgi:hypothetical protein
MAIFIPGKVTVKRRRAAMQAALHVTRNRRDARVAKQIKDNKTFSASPPNPDVMSGTQGNGRNGL